VKIWKCDKYGFNIFLLPAFCNSIELLLRCAQYPVGTFVLRNFMQQLEIIK